MKIAKLFKSEEKDWLGTAVGYARYFVLVYLASFDISGCKCYTFPDVMLFQTTSSAIIETNNLNPRHVRIISRDRYNRVFISFVLVLRIWIRYSRYGTILYQEVCVDNDMNGNVFFFTNC